jgi:glycosyltransferase involved in cell wall biosynthesis
MTTQAYRTRSPLLTIIIAAYNVEIYIDDALNSLLSHPFIDAVDIIVIDDGSQDRTYAVAKAVVEADGGEHVLLIHQSNGGLSDARNKGCAHVRTPYVGFLDGDDMFLPEFLSVVIPLLAGNWDMIEYNATIINDRNEPLLDLEIVPPVLAGGRDADRKTVMHFATRFHCFMWARVYRTTLFDPDPFPIGRHYEDAAVLPSVYLRARSIYYVTKPLICYRRRFGSITQNHLLQQVHDLHSTGREALARCNGGEHDEFWHTVYRKVFRREWTGRSSGTPSTCSAKWPSIIRGRPGQRAGDARSDRSAASYPLCVPTAAFSWSRNWARRCFDAISIEVSKSARR